MVDIDRTPVAGDIKTHCGKCDLIREHVVVSHLDGMVAKVQCQTCKSIHNYKSSNKVKKAPSARNTRKPVTNQAKEIGFSAAEYVQLMEKCKDKEVRPYNIKDAFKDLEIISHPTFGVGIVKKTFSNKMDVIFPDSFHILACNYK